jgi:hypothetical protein
MTTQYTTILKLALPVQGELSGTWGDVVNDNITQMVEQAVAGKAVVNTWTGNSHTLTTADGTTSESRCAILELTDSGTALTGAGTVVCPTNTKLYIVDNNTAEIITVQTAAGTGVAVPVGKTMLVYCDGTNVVEGVTHANSLSLGTSTVTADKILDEDNMASDSATAIATQQSIKAYVDSQVGTVDTLSEILANGNTTGANDIDVDSAQKVQFRDADIYLNSSVDGQLDIVADTEIQIAATTVDLNGNLDVSGTALVAGVLTTTAATVFNGGFASNADSTLGTDKKVQFRDAAIYLNSSVDGQLDIVADGEVQIDTALVDINGNLDVSGTTNISGSVSFTKNAIAGVAISTTSRASNTVTVTTSAVHGLTSGDLVNVNGVADTSFNGYFTVSVSSTTVFTYSQTGADGSSTGGTSTEVVYNLNASGTALNWMNGPLNIAANSGIDGLEITQSGAGNGLHVTGTTGLVGNTTLTGNLDVSGTTLVTGVLTTTAATVFNGGFASNADSTLGTDKKVQFRDSAIYINSSVDGQLDLVADTEIQIAATTIDVNGTLAFDSLKGTGATTVTNILDEDNMASDSATAIATQQSIKAYVDSQVGSFDTLAEVLAQGNTTGGTDLAVSTGDDITFADSSKAIFGAGSDLQIYHDGSNSYIKDQGTGNLNIQTNGVGVVIADTSASDLAVFNAGNGQVSLYNSGSLKLATTATGIDVTGSVTASAGITATTGTFSGNITKSVAPAANGGIVVNDGTNDLIALGTGGFGVNGGAATDGGIRAYNNLLFGTGSSSTERMRIDSSGNVGISESNPVAKIHIQGSGTSGQVTSSLILENSSSGTAGLQITGTAGSSHLDFMYGGGPSTGTNTLTAGISMTLEGSGAGNVGIGVSESLQGQLNVGGDAGGDTSMYVFGSRGASDNLPAGHLTFRNVANGVGDVNLSRIQSLTGTGSNQTQKGQLAFSTNDGSSLTERMRIDTGGSLLIGKTTPADLHASWNHIIIGEKGAIISTKGGVGLNGITLADNAYVDSDTGNYAYQTAGAASQITQTGGAITFSNAASGSAGAALTPVPRMTLDASGNLLVGKTVVDSATAGCLLTAGGEAVFTKNGGESLTLNRQTSDGIIVSLRKDNTTVGSIGSISGVVSYINLDPRSGGTGIAGTNTDSIIPVTGTGAVADGTKDLGITTARWRNLYLSGGVVFGATGGAVTSKTLDDYEEGTWTPTITNSTGSYTTQVGRYTKIGNLVYVNCNVNTAFTNTGTTSQDIGGLPFTSENVGSLFSVGTVFPVVGFNQGNSDIAAQATINTTSVALYTVAPTTGINYTRIVSNTFGTTVEFEFSLCYRAA